MQKEKGTNYEILNLNNRAFKVTYMFYNKKKSCADGGNHTKKNLIEILTRFLELDYQTKQI